MAITASDIIFRLSGGTSNTSPAASLGGARSTAGGTAVITTDTLNNVWDDVSGADSSSGKTEYRGIYVLNNHGSLTLTAAKIWISSNTTSADDTIDIALAVEGLNATMATIANETTAPATVTFAGTANSFATGLSLGNIPSGQHYGVWIKRVVNSNAQAANANPYTLSVQGETAA